MPDPQGFQIQLDNPARSFFPGETISGRVIVSFSTPKACTGIQLTFDGRAKIRLTEKKKAKPSSSRSDGAGTGSTRTGTLDSITSMSVSGYSTSEEKYFHHELILHGTGGNTEIILPTGPAFYPFQFTLPINLPSSFVSESANILYFITAELTHPRKHRSSRTVLAFTVNGILDLNQQQGLGDSTELSNRKKIRFVCCKSGSIEFKVSFPRTGFVPGENIEFSAELRNYSKDNVEQSSLTLTQTTILTVGETVKTQEKELRKITGPGVVWGGSETWSHDGQGDLTIPPLPPTRLAGCNIIDVQYKLKFEMEFRSSLTTNLSAELPITIGTIPLRSHFPQYISRPTPPLSVIEVNVNPEEGTSSLEPVFVNSHRNFNTSCVPSVPIFVAYPDLPPPSYAEAIEMVQTEQETKWRLVKVEPSRFSSTSTIDQTSTSTLDSCTPTRRISLTSTITTTSEEDESSVSEVFSEEPQSLTPQSPDPDVIFNSNLFAPNYVRS